MITEDEAAQVNGPGHRQILKSATVVSQAFFPEPITVAPTMPVVDDVEESNDHASTTPPRMSSTADREAPVVATDRTGDTPTPKDSNSKTSIGPAALAVSSGFKSDASALGLSASVGPRKAT